MDKIKLFKDYILIEKATGSSRTKNGLTLPATEYHNKQKGFIASVGKDITGLKSGDKVIYAYQEHYLYEDNKHVVVHKKDILGNL